MTNNFAGRFVQQARARAGGRPTLRASLPGLLAVLLFSMGAPLGAQLKPVNPPFPHSDHKAVACKACHSTEDGKGEIKVLTVTNCTGCHHSKSNRANCSGCHRPAQLGQKFERVVEAKLTVSKTPRSRTLTFAHNAHDGVSCRSCHQNAAKMRSVAACQSCHEQHHSEQRSCTTCHPNAGNIQEHTRAAHLSCAGAGCHKSTVNASLQTQRNVCLTCHADRVDHEPAGDCADCHMIPTKSRNVRAAR